MNESWKDFLKNKKREILLLLSLGLATLMLVGFFGFIYKGAAAYVPDEYIQARERTTTISREIEGLGNEVNKSLIEIASKDSIGDYGSALALARGSASRIDQIGAKAQELLGALESMIADVEKVRPASAVKVGKDAITVGIKMVERLVIYSKLSNDLVQTIEAKLSGTSVEDGKIQKTIDDINSEVRFINSLNKDYAALIKQFDSLTKGSQ